MIVPIWPTQSWYPKLLHMLVDVPRVLPSQRTTLQMPGMKQEVHPLIKKMVPIVCRLTSNPMRHRDLLKRQPLLSYSLRGKEPLSSTPPTSKGGLQSYCHQKQIDPVSATVPQALALLEEFFQTGVEYSGINTARSALSSVLKPVDGITFGAQESVKRFLKGVYQARPLIPRYTVTWVVNKVLIYLKSISTTECSFKDLTLKLVTKMSLVSAQRGQMIHYFSLEDMVVSETSDFYHF